MTTPKTSKVTVKVPTEVAPLTVGQLATGSYFKVPGSNTIFVKTDEWLGSGARCMNVATGELTPLRRESTIERLYSNVNVTVS